MRSFNLSCQGGFYKSKVKAAILENDDILLLSNTQVGDKAGLLCKEFNLEGYELLNNMKGVSIALRIAKNIKIMDARTDNEEQS